MGTGIIPITLLLIASCVVYLVYLIVYRPKFFKGFIHFIKSLFRVPNISKVDKLVIKLWQARDVAYRRKMYDTYYALDEAIKIATSEVINNEQRTVQDL